MKYLLFIFFCTWQSLPVLGQPDYPSAPTPKVNLGLLEYFYDTDPGAGNGFQVQLPASTDAGSFSFAASLADISSGFHRLYIRSRDENGVWSHTSTVFFDNYIVPAYSAAPPGSGALTAVEYFIDTDPGAGNATNLLTEATTTINDQPIAVNVSGLSGGVHRLYIRTKDEHGKWSLTHSGIFDNSLATAYPDAAPAAPPVGAFEYYIDTDPGFGNGTAVVISPGTDLPNLSVNIPLTGIAGGEHTLYIRSRQNPWSLSAYADFTYASVLPVTWLFVKGTIKSGKAVINWATSSESNTSHFTIEHSIDGRHFESIGKMDASGNTQSTRNYTFLHDQLKPGPHTYRIKQTDSDGQFSYSKIIHLFHSQGRDIPFLFPNPATSVLYINGYVNQNVKAVEFFDMTGKFVARKLFSSSQQSYSIDLSGMKTGIYLVRIVLEGATDTYKIYKQ